MTHQEPWEEEFDSAFDWIESERERCKLMYGWTADDLKNFIRKTIQSALEAKAVEVENMAVYLTDARFNPDDEPKLIRTVAVDEAVALIRKP